MSAGRFQPRSQDFAEFGDFNASDLRTLACERPMPAEDKERHLALADALDAAGVDRLNDVGGDWSAPPLPERWTSQRGEDAMAELLAASVRFEGALSRVIMLNASPPYDAERESHIKINLRVIRQTPRMIIRAWSAVVGGAYRGFTWG